MVEPIKKSVTKLPGAEPVKMGQISKNPFGVKELKPTAIPVTIDKVSDKPKASEVASSDSKDVKSLTSMFEKKATFS